MLIIKKNNISRKWQRLILSVLLTTVLLSLALTCPAADRKPATRTITDRNGKTVLIPIEPKRIACFFGPSYEKVFLLGAADKVAVMSIIQPPWSQKLNPRLKQIPRMESYSDPDVERILTLGVDLVFYWQWPQQTEKMAAAGIPVVCPYAASNAATSIEAFLQNNKQEIRFYGEVLGEKAKKIAEEYCAYYDAKINRILKTTSQIPEAKKPKVYYVGGRNVFATQGRYSAGQWLIEIAGGTFVTKDLSANFVDASMEQVITWNPDVILIESFTSPDAILRDPRWQCIQAVKDHRVYVNPQGVFLWGHGSSETVLFVLYLAKLLHPDQFRDIDLTQEVKDYYVKFYHYVLTDADVDRILKHLPPEDFEFIKH